MSIDEDEIREYLEGKKKLKQIDLPQDSNELDTGGPAKEVKVGQKSSSLARANYVIERDKRMQFGDKQAINEYMMEQTEIRQKLEQVRERKRMEYDVMKQADKLRKQMAKITDLDRENEKEDIEKLENKREKEIANVYDYFNCSEEFWSAWLKDNHKPEESPANVLIGTGTVGFVCELHRYKQTIPYPDGRLATSAYVSSAIEDHIRKHDPDMHKQAIISSINEKYDKLIQERKDKTLEDKDVTFKRELRDIDHIPTRPDGDAGLVGLNSEGRKLTKGDKARIRREEEAQNEKNRKIYRGLYS
jgi:hypothetical protein